MADISLPALQTAISKIKANFPSHSGRLEHIRCDVSKEADVAAMVSHLDSWGGVVSALLHTVVLAIYYCAAVLLLR